MRLRTFSTVFTLSIAMLGAELFAQPGGRNKKLEVGSPAPGLNVEEWVKGSFNPIDGNVYVLEFWATWCAPCRKSIPHLTAIQEEYELDELKVVGISTDEETEKVAPFVNKQGLKMDYIVGIDNKRRTQRAWMDAAGLKGIPAAFIVDKNGTIQFIGHPLSEEFDDTLAKVMTGRYDKKKEEEAAPSIKAAKQYRSGTSWSEATDAYENAIAMDPIVFARLNLELIEMYLLEQRDAEGAYAYINKVISDRGSEDPELLTWIAEYIATNDQLTPMNRRMDIAMKAAKTAHSFAKRKTDPKYLATIALVHFHSGDVDEAIAWQRKAYFSAREKDKEQYKFTLDSYRMQQQHASAD